MYNDFINLIKSFKIFVIQLFNFVSKIIVGLVRFLGPAENAVRHVVSPEEFYRIIVVALSAGGGFGGFIAYMKDHFKEFITDPNVAIGVQAFIKHCNDKNLSLAIFVLFFTMDYIRRKRHGNDV